MYLYLKDDLLSQRTLVLTTAPEEERDGCPSRALVFRVTEGNVAKVVVEFIKKGELDLSSAVRLSSRRIKGCLGLINVGDDTFLAVITSATEIGNLRPTAKKPEGVARIHDVGFFCLNSSAWDETSSLPVDGLPVGSYDRSDDFTNRNEMYQQAPPSSGTMLEHPCAPLMKILSSGTFYYALSPQWDISSRLLRRRANEKVVDEENPIHDDRFLWNAYIVRSLLDFRQNLDKTERDEIDRCQFIVLAIQGYVGVFTVPLSAPPTSGMPVIATISLISRLGWKRAGTRFNTRGIDDDGNCANFVETETIFNTDDSNFSYVQVRGSVPLFWEQQGLQTFGQKIQITRPHASQPAFEAHFENLLEEYHAVHAINLLGTKENEAILANSYRRHLDAARTVFGDNIGITNFDFHNCVRIGGHESVTNEITSRRFEGVHDNIERYGYTLIDATSGEIVIEQSGIFRTNCLDCLDRTNFVQDILSWASLEQYLCVVRREWATSISLRTNHRELWAENGDALSRIYAGTGALNTSYTRSGKRTLAGVLSDATKSVSRAYINNFQDKGKQTAIDMFLGNLSYQRPVTIHDPVHDTVNTALQQRLSEYSTIKDGAIFVGTWNLNARPPSESLLPWLFPMPDSEEPDLLVIGFQEIVQLNAQQILQADPEKRQIWEQAIVEALKHKPGKKSDYILLRSEQLVGTALLIFVKSAVLHYIRNVEATTRKTGLRGMSGNKGAVAIRLDYHDTSFCFITAHLAAGQTNVEERNSDYHTIADGLHFLKGKTIDSHDNIIWLADTNYRIDLVNESIRQLIDADELDVLVAADQLKKVVDSQIAFVGYDEGPLTFRPTYKYDVFTQRYDTGEKQRAPAWTDRILYRGDQLSLKVYSRAELLGSDHRPVYAIFNALVRIIDTSRREALRRLLLSNVLSTSSNEKLDEKLAMLSIANEQGILPPPSSDEKQWWIDNEHPDGVYVTDDVPNRTRKRRGNPFDSESSISSPSSSDEELYTDALSLVAPPAIAPKTTINLITRKPPPPPPPSRNTKPFVATGSDHSNFVS